MLAFSTIIIYTNFMHILTSTMIVFLKYDCILVTLDRVNTIYCTQFVCSRKLTCAVDGPSENYIYR